MTNTSGQFLAMIKLILEGKQPVISGVQEVQSAIGKLSKTKITTIFDKEGLVTGKQIEETFTKIKPAAEKAGTGIKDFTNAMRRAVIVAPIWMLMRGAMMAVFNTIRDQVKFLIDLETAMTRIKIVGKGTVDEYKNLQNALVGLAYTYGTTGSEAAEAALIFAQQGRTVKETIELTRAAMLASKILGTDIKTAVDDMTAAIEGFQLGIGDATSVVDKWINVERQFAVTSKDLADATKVAGASAHQLGITMSEFLGDVTAVVEVTRKSGSEAARGISFIYARLLTSGKKTVEQITKIPFYLNATGQATNEVGTQLRSVSSILEELAGKWDSLTTQEKLNIATALGSKRQMVVLNALMQNYTASLDARIAALTSAGAAERAFALIQDTTATKLKQVAAAWNVLTTAIGDTSGFKTSLSLFDKMIINLTALISYEKAYAALYSREINKVQLANETRLNEVKSIEELISVRNKLAKAPQTIENIDRLKKVQDAINAISAKEPRIRVAIETGSTEDLKKSIEDRLKELEVEKIRLNVSLEFEPKIATIEDEIKNLQNKLRFTGGTEAVKVRGELVIKEKEVKKLYETQAKTLDEQYKIQKGQEAARQALVDGFEEEESISEELTDAEKERLDIEQELLKIRYTGTTSMETQIQKEMELVKQSKNLYDAHTKNLKLEELGIKLLDTKLQKRKEEENSLRSLIMQYDKADMFEKGKIRRATELLKLSPEELGRAYEGDQFDKTVIIDYWNSFSDEGQRAIEEIQARLSDISLSSGTSIEGLTALAEELTRISRATGGVNAPITKANYYAPPIPAATPVINNSYTIPITLQGAITDENIRELLQKIEAKVKEQPNYIGNTNLLDALNNPEVKKKVANVAANTNT